MPHAECRHEADVLAAVSTGRWPERVDATLRAHVETCALCRDLITVVAAFEAEMDQLPARETGALPGAGLVWWRAQMRARQDAARLAVRPISVAQALAFAGTVGVLGALFGATATWFQQGVHWFGAAFTTAIGVVRPEWALGVVTDHSLALGLTVMGTIVGLGVIYGLVRLTEREA